ncbi:MAG TPA: universal stress protein [Vicinamibacterales bacterium]|jgi:nucleotide-binding universal stress UspA family protein
MIQIRRILCPVDFSDISQHALDHAAAIAHWYDATLTLLFVFPNLPAMDLPPLVLEDADRERLLVAMRRMADRVPARAALDYRVCDAPYIHDEIVAQAAATDADLLVLGTHGRSGFQRLFLGSVTEKVIRKAACPTLVVPPRAPDRDAEAPVEFRRILCPVDFSESSLDALALAINLAEEADGRLTLLHVVEWPRRVSQEPTTFDVDLTRLRESALVDARRRLHELIPEQARTYCTVETAVVEGAPHETIVRQAAEQRCDLIVMGVHGRGAIERLVFGSTTHQVIRSAACPVLIARQHALEGTARETSTEHAVLIGRSQ